MKKTLPILGMLFLVFGFVGYSQSRGTIQNNTNPALPNSYNFKEYVFAEPNDQGTCTSATNATATIQKVFFSQTHRLATDNPLFFIIGYRPALLQVAVTGSGTAPDVKVTGTHNGSPLGQLCLKGPTTLSSTVNLNIANFTNYFSVTLPKSWIKHGLELTITAGNATRTLTPAELKIGPYTELNLVQVDLDVMDYNTSPHNKPIFNDFLQEMASAIPASVVRHGVFPKTLKFPEYVASNGTEQLVRLTSKNQKAANNIPDDGWINPVALKFTSRMHRSTNDYLSTVYFGNTLNLAPGGWGGGKSFVGMDFTDVFIHELGHALSLPHWGDAYNITNLNEWSYLYPYGGVPNYGAGRGSSWNFIQDLYEFEDPICRLAGDPNLSEERSDAMQRGNKCLAMRSDGLSPWDGFGDFSAYSIHKYLVGASMYSGQVYDIQTNGLKNFQVKRQEGFPNMTLENEKRTYTRDPLQPQAKVWEERFTMPGNEALNQDVYLIYGSAHATQVQANIVHQPVEFNGTLPPVIDPTNATTLAALKTSPYRDFLYEPRDITLKLYYDDGSVLHMLNPYHSYTRQLPTNLGIWRNDVCDFSLVAPRGTKKLRKVEMYRRPFCVRGTNDTTEGNIDNAAQNITAANFMNGAVFQAEYVFDIFNLKLVSSSVVSCGKQDGSIKYSFSDNPNQSTIEFSVDGGVTFPYSVADNAGSITITNLAIGTYNVRARTTDGIFNMSLGKVTIGDCFLDCNGVENGTAIKDDCGKCIGGNTGQTGILSGVPQGYTYLGKDFDKVTLPGTGTVIWGANCAWVTKTNVSGTFTIGPAYFGSDPVPNVLKKAYFLPNGTTIDCNGIASGTAYLDSCLKCVGGNTGRTACSTITNNIAINSGPDVLSPGQQVDISVNYSVTAQSDIFLILQNTSDWSWPLQDKRTVDAGTGTLTFSFTVPNLPDSIDAHQWVSWITTVGGGWLDPNPIAKPAYIYNVDVSGTLSTNNENLKNKIHIYPNPVKENYFNIKIEGCRDDCKLEIFDITGRMVYKHENLDDSETTINVSNFNTGVYLLKIKAGDETINKKIIIE